jgi:hypothetical protein
MTLVNSCSISSILCWWTDPPSVHPAIVSIANTETRWPTETLTFDVLARKFRYLLHYFEHSLEGLLQDIRLFLDDFFIELGRQRENALQPIEKARYHPIVFVLFLQELNSQVSLLLPIHQRRARTPNTKVAIPTMTFAAGVGSN